MSKLTLRVDHDPDVESPCEFDGWKLYSFSRAHSNFKHPEDLERPGLRRKIQLGLAHILSCFQHGNVIWSLRGEGPQCRWDTAQVAGLLVWEGKTKDLGPRTPVDRTEDARRFLKTYNAWANGETYWYSVEDEEGETIASCGGYIGPDLGYMWESIREAVGENELAFKDGDHGSADDLRDAYEKAKK